MSLHTANSIVQLPNGFQCCVKPFGRLLASLDLSFSQHSDSRFYGPLKWLLNFLAKNEKKDAQEMREVTVSINVLICSFRILVTNESFSL